MKPKLFVMLIAALLFGAVSGYLGAIVDHYNHAWFGTSYSHWRLEWLALPSLPGQFIAELRAGYDWGADELWSYRYVVTISNALFWCLIALFFNMPSLLRGLCWSTLQLRPSNGFRADEY